MNACPTCESTDLRELELAGDTEYRPDVNGVVPTAGDTIVECGTCRDFVVGAKVEGPAAPKPLSKMTRPELEAAATELKIAEPDKAPNVGWLRKAIAKARGAGGKKPARRGVAKK